MTSDEYDRDHDPDEPTESRSARRERRRRSDLGYIDRMVTNPAARKLVRAALLIAAVTTLYNALMWTKHTVGAGFDVAVANTSAITTMAASEERLAASVA